MKNKIAVVTGGTNGIGTAICQHLATHEARVIATYHARSEFEIAKAWQKEQRNNGYDIAIKFVDITNTESCANIVTEIEDEYSAIDILVNNTSHITFITQHVIEGMIKRFYGRIINVASANHTSAELHAFTQSIAAQVASKGITINTVTPGYIENQMILSAPENIRDKIIASIPVGRLGRPEEIARVIGFLSAQASSFITGINLAINGGQS